MKQYKIIFSNDANNDIKHLFDFIGKVYKAPATAKEYINGLFSTIESLTHSAESMPISNRRSFLKYGLHVQRVNFRKMAIIYSIHGDIVYIHRIIPGAMIYD